MAHWVNQSILKANLSVVNAIVSLLGFIAASLTHIFHPLPTSAPDHRLLASDTECHSIAQALYHKFFLFTLSGSFTNASQAIYSYVLSSFCIFLEAVVLNWHWTLRSLARPCVKWVVVLNGLQGLPSSKLISCLNLLDLPRMSVCHHCLPSHGWHWILLYWDTHDRFPSFSSFL